MEFAATPQSNIPLSPDERLDVVNEQIRLIQKTQGLTYGTDAFLLASYIRKSPAARAVDLGSGTGIIPLLLLARKKVASVVAVEIQEGFVSVNGEVCTMRGKKLYPGDKFSYEGDVFVIVNDGTA